MSAHTPQQRRARFAFACLFSLGLVARSFAGDTHIEWTSPALREHPLVGQIRDREGKLLSEAQVREKMKAAAQVYIGEKHDNADHHALEARLIGWRLADNPESRIVFEMLDDAQAPLLPGASGAKDLDSLKAALNWPQKGWDWAAYGPLFLLAHQTGRLSAGNIGKALIGKLYGGGPAVLGDEPRFRTVGQADEAVRTHLLDRIFDAHCGMQSRDTLTPMLHIQLAKDASMASAMTASPEALLIAGGEHTRPDTGVPWHVRQQGAGSRALVIQITEVRSEAKDPPAYRDSLGSADLYWFTPATPAKDYCAEVKGKAAQ